MTKSYQEIISHTTSWLNTYRFATSVAMAEGFRASTETEVVALREKDGEKALLAGLNTSVDQAGCNIDHIVEKQLGGAEQVAAALDTMQSLEESPPEVVPPGDLTLLKAWGKASVAARQAGFRDLGEGEGAYFEVRLV